MSPVALLHLTLAAAAATAAPGVLDLAGGFPGLPVAAALEGLGSRVDRTPQTPADFLAGTGVVVLDGASDLTQPGLGGGSLEAFVARGGGVLIAGLADSLPRTAALWRTLGAAAPATVPATELFPEDSGDWLWIGTQRGESADHTRFIRRSFTPAKPVARAFVRCTVDNLYTLYLNGEEVGKHWSWYDHELWEITPRLRPDANVIAFRARNVDGPGGFFAQVGLEYEDGTRELIASDKTWKFRTSEEPGWQSVGFDDSAWAPATDILPMVQYTRIADQSIPAEGPLTFGSPHPILNAITPRFGTDHRLRGVIPRPGATVLASVAGHPVVVCGEFGKGRVVLVDTVQQGGGMATSDLADDLLANAVLWLSGQSEGLLVVNPAYPPPALHRGAGVRISFAVDGISPAVDGVLAATLTHNGRTTRVAEVPLRRGEETRMEWAGEETRDADADGPWRLDLDGRDAAGSPVFHRSVVCQVLNPLSVPSNRHVVAAGMTLRVRGDLQEVAREGRTVSATIRDPWGRELPAPLPQVTEGVHTWSYQVPDLAEGDYRLVVTISADGKVTDSFGVPFSVVPRLNLADFFSTTMRMSELRGLDEAAVERELDDIIAHGFNTLTFSAHRLGAASGSPYDFAEDLAQRKGMAVSYSFQGDFCLLTRDGLPPVSVFSPEYKDAIRPRIQAAVETCRQVPRLLNVQGYMDEPFQVSGDTFDDRPPAKEEFRRLFGIDMPTREQAMQDPALWLKYVDFWSDCFAAGWRQSYAMVKELCPDFWVELTHDSHCTFGAAGRNFETFWAVDDVYHWGAPFDSVNYDIYPYLSTDFRTGKFGENRLPRLAGMHMAFAQMRNLAYAYDKKLGFWLESGWSGNVGPGSEGRKFPWSPRELTYTALAAGCDYLNTFWGVPEDPAWWVTYGGVMGEVKALAPLLTRSRVPRAKAAFLFPRTQHVLLQEEYWNVMVALEAFRQAYGELDCIHEEQLAGGGLDAYQALVLFDVHLLKRKDAETIREWVRSGGRLVADEIPSLDEGKAALGVFEDVFKLAGSAQVVEGAVRLPGVGTELWGRRSYEADGEPVGGVSQVCGKGRAVLLNFPLKDCYLDALLRGQGAETILGVLRWATEGAPANVTASNPGIEAALRLTPQGTALLFLINHESKDETTRVSLPHLAPGGVVRDLITGERVAAGPQYDMTLTCPWGQTRALGVFPSDPAGVALTGLQPAYSAGETVELAATLGGQGIRGSFLLDLSVLAPDGRAQRAFSALTCTEDATCRRSFRLPVNAPAGQWTVRARSLWDGAEAAASFTVR